MDDEFEEEIEELMDEAEAEENAIEAGVPDPRFRATWNDGRLVIIPHHAGLAGSSAIVNTLGGRTDLLIADLSANRDRMADGTESWELTVDVLTLACPAEAARALAEWAGAVGFRRMWFPGQLIELEPLDFHGPARVDCELCGQSWSADGMRFWRHVRKAHSFPTSCEICGADLPVWEVERYSKTLGADVDWELLGL